ncbi:MAG: glycoside hydrolase [Lewinellaceae bacterium]|nr:glycoside hydrolase [Lewinellaceae bacterium]
MYETLLKTAQGVLENNWNGTFTKPAPSLYPHQWNWDAGFIAIGNAHYNMDRAEADLRHLFSAQWANGLLPQIVFGEDPNARYFPGPDFWLAHRSPNAPESPRTSGITMPPVHGFALWRIYEIAEDKQRAKAFLKEMYPKVVHLHRYLYQYRDPHEEGLVYIRHPWEGGTDNSPIWDSALKRMDISKLKIPPYERKDLQNPQAAKHRPTQEDYDRYVYLVDLFRQNNYDDAAIYEQCPFLIQDPLFNGVLAWSNECLVQIGGLLGEDVTEIVQWDELTRYSMNEKLWDEERGLYNAYDLRNEELIPVYTSSGLMPLCGDVPTQEQAEKMLLTLESELFGGKRTDIHLCPTYSLLAEDVDFKKYWRGPVWINMNWLLYHGLLRYDMEDMAARVRQHSLELLEKHGIYEYFDPRIGDMDGVGCGTDTFSWSAALCIDLLMGP